MVGYQYWWIYGGSIGRRAVRIYVYEEEFCKYVFVNTCDVYYDVSDVMLCERMSCEMRCEEENVCIY